MYKNAFYVGIFLVVGVTLAACVAAYVQLPRQIVHPVVDNSAVVNYFEMRPGFQAFHTSRTGSWRWQYGKVMASSCQNLTFGKNSVQLDGVEHFTIHISTSTNTNNCTYSRISYLRGNLNAPQGAKFSVMVDGKVLLP